eukprot:scaffold3123_cov57-Attheya_sp.AAC.1
MMFSTRVILALVLSACTVAAYDAQPPDCKDLAIGEEFIHPGEDLLCDLNAKLMAEVVVRRDAPGHAFRAFHPKTLGCLHGEFVVNKRLAKDLQVGLFTPGATYKTIAHFATSTPIHPPGKKKLFLYIAELVVCLLIVLVLYSS